MTNLILIFGIAAILIVGTIAPDQIAFADDNDHEKECKEDLEDFINKTNKLVDKEKLSEEQGQSLISLVEELIENDCGTINEINDVKALVVSYDLKKKDSEKLIDELEDAIEEIRKGKITLELECEKHLDKKYLKIIGLFCAAIFDLQQLIADLQAQINGIELIPDSCLPGEIVKWDGSSWICAQDEGGGGTTDIPLDEIKLIPQSSPLSPCTAENLGIIYYQENPGTTSGILCVCSFFENEFVYTDLIGENICVP